jgi:hypothetical protein
MGTNPEVVLAQQLAMNRATWSALVERGVGPETMLVLEFAFWAPGEQEARSLVLLLHGETDYEVSAPSSKTSGLSRRSWEVTGKTRPTAVSLEILDQWVGWMVAAGSSKSCEFDGWGTVVP